MLQLREAIQQDLTAINQVIEAAIMTWDLPERVKRLSLPSYFYNEVDFQHFQMALAEQDEQVVGVVAWEQADSNHTPDKIKALLIHGLYVHPQVQHQGIATKLFKLVEDHARQDNYAGLLVKAQADATGFFLKRGMKQLPVTNEARDYANRLWKRVSA